MKDLWIWLVVTAVTVVAFVFFFSMGQKAPTVEQTQGHEQYDTPLAVSLDTLQGAQPVRDPTQTLVSIWPTGSCDKFTGTGFFISDKGHILTAAHVVRTFEVGQQVTVQWAPPGQQPQRFTAIVLHKKPEWDIALLKIQDEEKTFPWLGLEDSDPERLHMGDKVTITGFPQPAALGCTTPTIINGELTARRPSGDFLPVEVLQIAAPILRPGSSGSPVTDTAGKVIGILFGGAGTLGPGPDLAYYLAVPINVAAETDALKLYEVLPPYSPEITSTKFPSKIIGDGQPYKGKIGFRDLNRDVIKARFQIAKGSGVKIWDAEEIKPAAEFVLTLPRPAREKVRGEFEFDLSVAMPNQEVTVNLTLEDEQKNPSAAVSFSFLSADYLLLTDFTECRKQEPVLNWGAFYEPPDWARQDCFPKDPVEPTTRGGVMQIAYDVSKAVAGFWMQWDVQDFKPDGWDALSFFVRGDSKKGFSTKIKVEMKIGEARWGWRQYCLEGVTDKWQRVTIPLEKFVPDGAWDKIDEFVIAFANYDPNPKTNCSATVKRGAIYFDQITLQKKN